jgi:D-galactose 1-dehydrogenase
MIRLGIIGFGKIARDAHLPALTTHGGYDLKAVVTHSGCDQAGVRCFDTADAMLADMTGQLDAVTISTPPGPRYAIGRQCLAAGLDLLLEKPPTTTLGEIAAMRICWHEDVQKYHPGQDWVWEPEGFGVFDPGINALSIASRILPAKLILEDAVLRIPENRQQPIVAKLTMSSPVADGPIHATFDWCPAIEDEWTITVELADGRFVELRRGGAELLLDGEPQTATGPGEYPAIYAEFVHLVAERRSRVDIEPLRLVADALMIGRREVAPAFHWKSS